MLHSKHGLVMAGGGPGNFLESLQCVLKMAKCLQVSHAGHIDRE